MAAPTEQSGVFINLKRVKDNFQPSVVKSSVQPSVETVVQPSEDVSVSFTSLDQKKALLLQAFAQLQKLPNVLPAPTFASAEKFPVEEKEAPLQQTQPSKTFTEGPQLPVVVDKADDFGVALRKDARKAIDCGFDLKSEVSPPATEYSPGEIKNTTKGALKQMVQDLPRLNSEKTGCIIDEKCDTECNDYIEEKNFISRYPIECGSFRKVDLCYDIKTWKPFMRKQLPKTNLRTSEVIVHMTLNHDNITKFYGLIQRECNEEGNPTMELLIEYAGVSLNKYMLDGNCLTHEQIWDLSKQGLEALAHISHYSIVHLDIKPENICVAQSNGTLLLKLTDFRFSKHPGEPSEFIGLTPEYMAPEMCKMILQTGWIGHDWRLREADITEKVDTFSFGLVIMYMYKGYHILVKEISNGKTTYEGLDVQTRKLLRLNLMILMANDNEWNGFVQNLIPEECDRNMRALLGRLLEYSHQDRFSARQGLDFIEEVCMEYDNSPVKNSKKVALRKKLKPYDKSGKKEVKSKNLSSSKGICMRVLTSEMNELRQGSHEASTEEVNAVAEDHNYAFPVHEASTEEVNAVAEDHNYAFPVGSTAHATLCYLREAARFKTGVHITTK